MVVDSTLTPSLPATGGGIDADLTPGQVVGEYQVERKIGQGGFGAVFKAVHPLIGKQVAIKVLSQRFSVDPQMVSRFVSEARAVNQIRHHNIIDIFSFGTLEDGRFYYVMEFLDGEPLDRRLARRGRMPLAEALPVLRAIARALDAAHAKGIAHRDLKAENIFLAAHPDGVFPKLLDFGIAKLMTPEDVLSHKTRTGAPMGTPHYMSPEQCHGRAVDHRTDMYAFGVLAYLMLTGAYPLDGDDYMAILMRQVHDEPVPPSQVRPELPAGVDAAIAWLMRKDPAARPGTLMEAVRMLEQVAVEAASAGPPPTPGGSSDSLSTLPVAAGDVTPGGSPAMPPPGGVGAVMTQPTPSGQPIPSARRAPSGPQAPSGNRTPDAASSTTGPGTAGAPGAPPRAFAVSAVGTSGEGPAVTAPESRPPENRRPESLLPAHRPLADLPTASLPPERYPSPGRPAAARRRPAPHVLLAAGALLAAVAIVAVIVIRSGQRAEAPAAATQDGSEEAVTAAMVLPDAAPPPADAAPPPADAAGPARPSTVLVTIEGTPPNTEVRRAGALVGIAPGRVELPRSDADVMLVLSADGYLPATITVVPSKDLTSAVKLKPRAGGARPAGGSGARPAGGSGARPAGGSGTKPGSDEPTDDILPLPPAAPPAKP
jgi:serine/threonine protein kinase